MKQHLLLFFTWISIYSDAQVSSYHPMLDSVNRWIIANDMCVMQPEMSNCNYPFWPGGFNGDDFSTDIDTIINSITYKKLIADGNCNFGFIREDTSTKKVYFMDNIFNAEQLLYDFDLQIGDSIPLVFYSQGLGQYWQNGNYFLDSIKTVSTLSGIRNEFFLNCDTCSNSNTLRWIEGIGNVVNPIYTYSDNYLACGIFLMFGCPDYPHNKGGGFVSCFEHNQRVYLDSCALAAVSLNFCCFDVLDSCHYSVKPGSVSDFDFSTSIKISSSPFHDRAELTINNLSVQKCNLRIYDLTGRVVQEEIIDGHFTIEGQKFEAGIYLFRLFSSNGKYAAGKLVKE